MIILKNKFNGNNENISFIDPVKLKTNKEAKVRF